MQERTLSEILTNPQLIELNLILKIENKTEKDHKLLEFCENHKSDLLTKGFDHKYFFYTIQYLLYEKHTSNN